MEENWKDVPGFEGRYQVSDLGRVKSLPFMQRYLLRNGKEAFRLTHEIIRKQKTINSGYKTVSLWLDDVETTVLVHRLVAVAFVPGSGETVNHRNGVKTRNAATNLEWASYSENHRHAVEIGLNTRAVRVAGPGGEVYPSIRYAARATGVGEKMIRNTWRRV